MKNILSDTAFLVKYRVSPPDVATRLFLTALQPASGAKALVLQYTDNHIPSILADKGYDVVALDSREPHISPVPSKVFDVSKGYFLSVHGKAGSYDLITAFNTFQYYDAGWTPLASAKSLGGSLAVSLKKGGLLFLSVPIGSGHNKIESGRVFGKNALKDLGLSSLEVVSRVFAYSEYPLTGGRSEAVKSVKESEAFDVGNKQPHEMFCVLRKMEK